MKITRQQLVVVFEIDELIMLTCGPALKNVQTELGGQVLTTNIPDGAPPSMPRIILKLKDANMSLGLDRIQLSTFPPSHISEDIEKSSEYTLKRAAPFFYELLPKIPKYFWAGVITELRYYENPLKSKSANEVVIPIFDKLLNIDRQNKELASFQIKYGFKEDDCFVNYTLAGFEDRQVELQMPPAGKDLFVDLSEKPITGCGVMILMDINNKPNKNNDNPIGDVEALLLKQKLLISNIAQIMNLEGVLL